MTDNSINLFNELGLELRLVERVKNLGFKVPTPVQSSAIPLLLNGNDIVAKAQTGTGKTAAFALPVIQNIDLKRVSPQCVVLAPTRELAIQVADAFREYARELKGLNVATLYGGSDYQTQLKQLKKGAHVVVGTTGRLMDHMRRGSLKLNDLKTVVLDEADEMLRMGFIEDVEWILSHVPESRQTALFSATMPQQIRKIANKYLSKPKEIFIKDKTETAQNIDQHYIEAKSAFKLHALKRILEVLEYDGMIIFVRTKSMTTDITDCLKAMNLRAEALNGDIVQQQRKRTVDNLKNGRIDILVATDVAARGIDIERVSCVVNFDMPYDVETYIHRIGRTGRAGRQGKAILFLTPSEKRARALIEKKTKQRIQSMEIPTAKSINKKRVEDFKASLQKIIENGTGNQLQTSLEDFQKDTGFDWSEIALALSKKLQDRKSFLLDEKQDVRVDASPRKHLKITDKRREAFRIEVGRLDGVKPRNIVGAIANEGEISSDNIGRIDIQKKHSIVHLPVGLPKHCLNQLKKARVCGKQIRLSRV